MPHGISEERIAEIRAAVANGWTLSNASAQSLLSAYDAATKWRRDLENAAAQCGGVKIVSDTNVPGGEIHVHHPDGRIEKFSFPTPTQQGT